MSEKMNRVPGDKIKTFDELFENEWVFYNGLLSNIYFVKQKYVRQVEEFLKLGLIRKAIIKEREDD